MSCRMSSKRGLASNDSTLSRVPVKKLSMQMTSCPRATSRSQRCEPRNPAPPVTRGRLRVDADSLVMARGSAVREGDELVITHAGQGGETVISLVTDLRSADFPVIAWVAIDVPASAQVVLLWHTDYEPAQVRKLPLRVVSGRL